MTVHVKGFSVLGVVNKLCYQVTHSLPPAKEENSLFYKLKDLLSFSMQDMGKVSLTALPLANSSPLTLLP